MATFEGRQPHDSQAEDFINNVKRDAESADNLTWHNNLERMLDEVEESLERGIHSHEEASALAAKLSIVGESTGDRELKERMNKLRQDLRERHPGAWH